MNKIEVSKKELLKRLETNLAQHKKEHAEALVNFKKQQLQEVEDWLQVLKEGDDIICSSRLIKPVSYEKYYEQVIDMIKMSVEKTIILEAHDFLKYCRDEWEWQEGFKSVTALYNSKR